MPHMYQEESLQSVFWSVQAVLKFLDTQVMKQVKAQPLKTNHKFGAYGSLKMPSPQSNISKNQLYNIKS